jgi:enoyl-CoA hydratase/carnithine racemase
VDTNLSISFNVGILRMNREHRYNTLTSHYIKSLSRGIESLNRDDNVKLIYMSPQNGEHFSNGTDFRTIMYHKNEQNYEKIA